MLAQAPRSALSFSPECHVAPPRGRADIRVAPFEDEPCRGTSSGAGDETDLLVLVAAEDELSRANDLVCKKRRRVRQAGEIDRAPGGPFDGRADFLLGP